MGDFFYLWAVSLTSQWMHGNFELEEKAEAVVETFVKYAYLQIRGGRGGIF